MHTFALTRWHFIGCSRPAFARAPAHVIDAEAVLTEAQRARLRTLVFGDAAPNFS